MSYKQSSPILLVMLALSITIQAKPNNPSTTVEDQSPAKTLIAAFRSELSLAENFAKNKQDKSDFNFITGAKEAELKDLDILANKKLTQITLWSLNEDIKFLGEYRSSGDSDYLRASINDVKSTVRANQRSGSKEKEVSITVQTIPKTGYQIWWTLSDWADLDNPPALPFGNPSESTESFPKDKSITLWSRDYSNASKVGLKTPCITNVSKSISIGSPPP